MIKKRLSNFGYLVLASLFSTSVIAQAKKPSSTVQKLADIYATGGCRDSKGNFTAMYYKNGQPGIPLMEAEKGSATSILVVGNDVYVTGDLNGKAVYWKNGQLIQLPSTALPPACAFSIAVSGNDVYVVGNGYKPFRDKNGNSGRDVMQPRYWKNGQEILLPQPPGPNGYEGEASAEFITVADNDVYIIGRYGYMPVYWKNGQRQESISNELQRVSNITTANGSVYAVGAQNKQAAYWKNGLTKVLTTEESIATAIAVSGNDVYVTGVIGDYQAKNLYPGYGNPGEGLYWKNGQPMKLNGATGPYPTSIAVSGNDVYVAGIDQANVKYMLWKNGQPVELSNGQCSLDPWHIVTGTKGSSNKLQPAKTIVNKEEIPQIIKIPFTPKEESDLFFAENKKKPSVTTLPSGLQYEIISQGTGSKPLISDRVEIINQRTLMVGKEIKEKGQKGSSVNHIVSNLLPGLAQGLLLMNVGSKYKFYIPPKLAYGESTSPGYIVIFETELLEITK